MVPGWGWQEDKKTNTIGYCVVHVRVCACTTSHLNQLLHCVQDDQGALSR